MRASSPRAPGSVWQLALEDAAEHDPTFAEALTEAVAQVRDAAGQGGGHSLTGNLFTGNTAIQQGDHNQQTNSFGA
ncbi:hypothetical protein [Frankia sp. AgB32]|uniref:hypothetical protein n=1 Tax=Frankia sp. AgB32 TaxID=631119 RepID=UPI00200D2A34|nr:hypothetical protein [Frankia sp. AgB32]MCK9897004.1 hypothetical protein [Frankia sp. AgB32]